MNDLLKRVLDFGSLSDLIGHGRKSTDGAFGNNMRRGTQRLQRATGPGSLNEANEMRALVEAGKGDEAATYFERCHQINFRAGKPKVRWGREWYIRYTANKLAAEYGKVQS
jgi:hypothetical protein